MSNGHAGYVDRMHDSLMECQCSLKRDERGPELHNKPPLPHVRIGLCNGHVSVQRLPRNTEGGIREG